MFRRRVLVLLLSVPTSAIMIAGCTDDEKATPQIIFDGNIERGGAVKCQDVGDLFKVGDFGNLAAEPPVPSQAVKDGDAFGQGAVSVSCSVVSSGANQFSVNASVDLSGATGGLFRVSGTFTTSGEQQNVQAFFSSRKSTNSYQQNQGCTVTYTNPAVMGVAAGRVWGHIVCPKALNVKLGDPDNTCQGVADFRFENCAQ
jgi:hypothetical protein